MKLTDEQVREVLGKIDKEFLQEFNVYSAIYDNDLAMGEHGRLYIRILRLLAETETALQEAQKRIESLEKPKKANPDYRRD